MLTGYCSLTPTLGSDFLGPPPPFSIPGCHVGPTAPSAVLSPEAPLGCGSFPETPCFGDPSSIGGLGRYTTGHASPGISAEGRETTCKEHSHPTEAHGLNSTPSVRTPLPLSHTQPRERANRSSLKTPPPGARPQLSSQAQGILLRPEGCRCPLCPGRLPAPSHPAPGPPTPPVWPTENYTGNTLLPEASYLFSNQKKPGLVRVNKMRPKFGRRRKKPKASTFITLW